MGNVIGDIRYAWRSLLRQPTFAGVAVLTLVLGIGLNTAIFSVIKAVLLNQLPYQDPSRLVVLWEQSPTGTTDLVAPLTFVDWQEQSLAVRSMAAFRQLRYAFAGNSEPLDVPSVKATPGLFAMLRVNAMLGRTFLPEEGTPGADRVAILSQSFWERHFGGSPGTIGRKIQLDAQPYTVIGVMPAAFDFPPGGNVDIWTPLSFDPSDAHGRSRKGRALNVVGRLADGVPLERAQRDMTLIPGRRARTARRVGGRTPRARAARGQPAAHAGGAARRRRAALRPHRVGARRARLRPGAGAPGVARGTLRHDERVFRRDAELRRPAAQRARRDRRRAGADAAGRR